MSDKEIKPFYASKGMRETIKTMSDGGVDLDVIESHIKELEAKLTRIQEIIGMEDGGRINDAYDRIVELMEDAE